MARDAGADASEALPLASPPRSVPWRVSCDLLTSKLVLLGSFIYCLCSLFLVPFVLDPNWLWEWRLTAHRQQTVGRLQEVRRTIYPISKRLTGVPVLIYRYDYTFPLRDGSLFRGHSYSKSLLARPVASDVPVEYDPDDPRTSRIVGTRTGIYPAWTVGVALVLLLLSLALVGVGLARGLRGVWLLRDGRPASDDDLLGLRHLDGSWIVHKDRTPVQPVLYDPRKPGWALAVSRLVSVWTSSTGEWREALGWGPVCRGLTMLLFYLAAPAAGWLWARIYPG